MAMLVITRGYLWSPTPPTGAQEQPRHGPGCLGTTLRRLEATHPGDRRGAAGGLRLGGEPGGVLEHGDGGWTILMN